MRRLGFILLLTAVLAGCQSDKSGSASSGAVPDYSNDPTTRRYEVMTALLEYTAALNRACLHEAYAASGDVVLGNNLTARDECAMRKIRLSLSFLDIPEAACQEQVINDLLSCMLVGSAAARIVSAAGSNPDEVMKWSDPDASLKIGAALLGTRAALICGQDAPRTCIGREIGRALLLPAEVVETCAEQLPGRPQGRCLATEFMLDHIRSAALYLE